MTVTFVVLVAFAGLAVWLLPEAFVDTRRLTANERAAALNGARQPIGVICAAAFATVAAGLGVWINRSNLQVARQSLAAAEERHRLDAAAARSRDEETRKHQEDVLTHERERTDDDRFAAAVKLLGDEAASVRVGALHALHRLGELREERRQTVIDVMCAYLRQPFTMPGSMTKGESEGLTRPARQRISALAEKQVRDTASLLIPKLLTDVHRSDGVTYSVELGSAVFDSLLIKGKRLRLNAAWAEVSGILLLENCWVEHDLMLLRASIMELRLEETYIEGNAFIMQSTISHALRLTKCRVDGELFAIDSHLPSCSISDSLLLGPLSLTGSRLEGDFRLTGSIVRGEASLGATFERRSVISKCVFEGDVDCYGGDFQGASILRAVDARNGLDLLTDCKVADLRLTDVQVDASLDLPVEGVTLRHVVAELFPVEWLDRSDVHWREDGKALINEYAGNRALGERPTIRPDWNPLRR